MIKRSANGRRASNGRSPLEKLIGRSEAMRRVRDRIRRISRSHVPVLIHGETGTGKELCAEAIAAEAAASPFIPVNCAAFAEGVIDSELFGHERGAFTGADRAHTGLVAAAQGGILFLDELAEVSPAAQAKLLRTLESGEYRPVGSSRILRSTFRVIAATSGNVDELVEAEKLRPDLLHRLGALRILLPPLRERLEDLPFLAEEFLRRYALRSPGGPSSLGDSAMEVLMSHAWPGNVRQLRNVVEAAAALAGAEREIGGSQVIEVLSEGRSTAPTASTFPTLAEVLDRTEKRVLIEALGHADQNRERAARLLDVSEATLYRKLAKHFKGPHHTAV
jgi:DNA-binding NtrC family response regulator